MTIVVPEALAGAKEQSAAPPAFEKSPDSRPVIASENVSE